MNRSRLDLDQYGMTRKNNDLFKKKQCLLALFLLKRVNLFEKVSIQFQCVQVLSYGYWPICNLDNIQCQDLRPQVCGSTTLLSWDQDI